MRFAFSILHQGKQACYVIFENVPLFLEIFGCNPPVYAFDRLSPSCEIKISKEYNSRQLIGLNTKVGRNIKAWILVPGASLNRLSSKNNLSVVIVRVPRLAGAEEQQDDI